MMGLIKANLYRLFKNNIFIAGLALASVITFYFVKYKPMEIMSSWDASRIMIFVSAATLLYFSFFTGLFIGGEYKEGAIRNRVIIGYSQLSIYVSNYIAIIIGLVAMYVMWLIGGVAAGVGISTKLITYMIVAIFYNSGYIGIIMAVSFRVKNLIIAVISGIGLFYFSFNSILIMNFFSGDASGVFGEIYSVFYNIFTMGQFFVNSGLMSEEINVGYKNQILLSIIVCIVAFIAGTMELKNRDIK